MNLIYYGKNEIHGRKSFVMANRWMHMNKFVNNKLSYKNNHMNYDMYFIISSKASHIYDFHSMLWLLDDIMNGNVYCRKFQWTTKTPCKLLPTLGIINFKGRLPLHLVVKCHSWKKYISHLITKKVHKSPKTPWRRIEVNLYWRVLFYTYYWKFWPCLMKCSSKVKNHSIIQELQV